MHFLQFKVFFFKTEGGSRNPLEPPWIRPCVDVGITLFGRQQRYTTLKRCCVQLMLMSCVLVGNSTKNILIVFPLSVSFQTDFTKHFYLHCN